MNLEDVDTPALAIDRDRLERNLDRMAELLRDRRVKLRPHAKTHKTPIVARMQLERGAVGICCAKLGEAEVLAGGGIEEILITTEIAGEAKIARLIALARRIRPTIVVDSEAIARPIARAAAWAGVTLRTLVDIDVGQHRTGSRPGEPAVDLGRTVARMPGLELVGLQGYEGHIQHIAESDDRRRANGDAMDLLVATARAFAAAGLSTEIVTTGGTGTGLFAAAYDEITDVQPGSYAVMDAQYGGVRDLGFENALTLVSRVLTVRDNVAVVDAGFKSLSMDAGMPYALGLDAAFTFAGDEHGKLTFAGRSPLAVGDTVQLVPSHCDTTINLHDEYVIHRDGSVVDRWAIAARGRVR